MVEHHGTTQNILLYIGYTIILCPLMPIDEICVRFFIYTNISFQRWWEASDRRSAILQYVAENVPRIYCLQAEPQTVEEEERIQEHILQPLEYFLFGEDPCVGLEKLQQRSGGSSSQLCGRVFKEGETVYSCRLELAGFTFAKSLPFIKRSK